MLTKKTSYFHFSVVFVFDFFVIDYDENKEIGLRLSRISGKRFSANNSASRLPVEYPYSNRVG